MKPEEAIDLLRAHPKAWTSMGSKAGPTWLPFN